MIGPMNQTARQAHFNSKLVRSLRQEKGMTMDALGKALHRSRQAVFQWEIGQTQPPVHVLPDLANILGVNVGDFFTE
jgi:transcriptional regulator with XRE-family HTH domain